MCVVRATAGIPAILLTTHPGVDARHYWPLITGLMCDVLLTTHRGLDAQHFTDYSLQGGCATFYWPLITGWMHNVLLTTHYRVDARHLLTTHYRVDAQRFTDDPSGGGCMKLLTTHHRVDVQCLTDHSSGGGCTTSYWPVITGVDAHLTDHDQGVDEQLSTEHSSGGGCMTLMTTHNRVRRLTDHTSGDGRPTFYRPLFRSGQCY